MNTILFKCPDCAHQMQLPEAMIGQKGECPSCKQVIVPVVVLDSLSSEQSVPPPAKTASLPRARRASIPERNDIQPPPIPRKHRESGQTERMLRVNWPFYLDAGMGALLLGASLVLWGGDFFPPDSSLLFSGGYLACGVILLSSSLALISGKVQETLRLQVAGLIVCQVIILAATESFCLLWHSADSLGEWFLFSHPAVVTLCLLAAYMRRCRNWWNAAFLARLTVVVEIGWWSWGWSSLFNLFSENSALIEIARWLTLVSVVVIAIVAVCMIRCKKSLLASHVYNTLENEFYGPRPPATDRNVFCWVFDGPASDRQTNAEEYESSLMRFDGDKRW